MRKTQTVGFRLTPAEYEQLRTVAEGKGIMTASLIRMIVVGYLTEPAA